MPAVPRRGQRICSPAKPQPPLYTAMFAHFPKESGYMATPSATGRPSPERIFSLLNAFQNTAALQTGIELDVFTAIGSGSNTPAMLATKTGASERGLRILCDYLTIMGLDERGRPLRPRARFSNFPRSPLAGLL